MDCPDENVLGELARGALDSRVRAEVEAHLHECEVCSDVVAQLAQIFSSSFAEDPEPPEPEPSIDAQGETTLGDGHPKPPHWPSDLPLPEGAKLGRYVVLRAIGAGAMGIVYAAYDPELDRKVALKLLRRSTGAASLDANQSQSGRNKRLLREAQALARLAHPHAITVHDVGTWEGQVFLAMEFVEGGTLTHWLRSAPSPRTWREVRRVFRQAGEGLAAAHEAGLVHRDFKPDNVLLHESGRAVVTDFGLARPLGSGPDEASTARAPSDLENISGSSSALSETLTRTGALVGTPAYMAPEQIKSRRCDAQSDQFAFCVALYEGLYGERPFKGRTLGELVSAVHEHIPPAPRGSDVPRWLRRVVLRGLSVRPQDRHPDMRSLLVALQRKRLGTWQSVAAMAVISTAAAAATAMLIRSPAPAAPPTFCDDVAAKLEGVWDDDTRQAMHDAFARSGLVFAGDAAARVSRLLDDYAQEWTELQTDACHSEVEGREPASVVAVRMTCLEKRRSTLGAMRRALAQADGDGVTKSIDAVQALDRPRDCADVSALGRSLPPVPEDERERVERARLLLTESQALRALGKAAQARAKASEASDTVEGLTYGPVLAETRLEAAIVLHAGGELDAAETALHEGLTLAVAHDHDRVVAQTTSGLAQLESMRMTPPVVIERWVALGRAALDSLGGDHPDLRANLGTMLGSALQRAGQQQEAIATLRDVLALSEQHHGPRHHLLAEPLNWLGMAYARIGDRDQAIEHIERARAILRESYGDRHPNYVVALQYLANAHLLLGDYADALALFEQAHHLYMAARGARHPTTAVVAYSLATTLTYLERYDQALAFIEQAQAAENELYGPRSRVAAISWSLTAEIHSRSERLELAEETIRRAIEILSETEPEPEDAVRRASYDGQLAAILMRTDREDEAEERLVESLRVLQERKGEPSLQVSAVRGRLAMLYLAQGRLDEARTMADASVQQIESLVHDPHSHAEAWFRRAKVLAAVGQLGPAREQAERARAIYAERADQPSRLAAVEDWLAEHPG